MHRLTVLAPVLTAAASVAVLALGAAPASAESQPADLGNVADITRGASAPGPHCHYVLPAADAGPFDTIISGAAHEAHMATGLPTGVFMATACP